MYKKILPYFLILSAIIYSSVYAKDNKNANIEKGFRFGDFNSSKEEDLEKLNKKDIGKILILILKEEKKQSKESIKQTKLQEEIRDILQNEFDPKPKMITVNGKKCLENEDAECFKMPMINEIKGIPAIAEAYKKQTLPNIKKRELWYAKYTQVVLRDSYLKGQAIRELGPKYPLATRPLGTVDIQNGMDGIILSKHRKYLFEKHLDSFEYNLFLGKNTGMDLISLVPLAYVARNNPKVKMNLIFYNEKQKILWEKQYKNFFTSRYLKRFKVFIQPKAFEEFKVYTTPSLFLKDTKNSKDTLIHVGKFVSLDFINKTLAYMLEHKFIKRTDLAARNAWNTKESKDFMKFYFKHKEGIKFEK